MPDQDYVAEMSRLSRLRSLDEETRRLYDKECSECKTFVDQLKAAYAALKKKKKRDLEGGG